MIRTPGISIGFVATAIISLSMVACGGGGAATSTTLPPSTTASTAASSTTTAPPTTAPATTSPATTVATNGGLVSLVAGIDGAQNATVGEDGPATQAALNNAEDIAVAPNGDIYIADRNSQRLLKVSDGILTVAYRGSFNGGENDFAGVDVGAYGTVYFSTGLGVLSLASDGTVGQIVADDGTSTAVGNKIAVGPDGSVYVSDERNARINRIAPGPTSSLVAGTGTPAETDVVGDGGPATEAQFNRISDIVIDSQGVLYVSDEGQGVVRRVEPDGTISTVFGGGEIDISGAPDGTSAKDVRYGAAEIGIDVDTHDGLYVVIRLAAKVIQIENGKIVTIAGGGRSSGPGYSALNTLFQAPFRIAFDPNGDMLILVEDGHKLYRVPGVAA